MDWLLATPQIQSAFSSLGSFEGDIYVVSPNALAVLEEINYKLTYEDQTLRTFRRAIGFCQNVRTDLIPLLVNAKDDTILESVIRILVNLTVPVECLFSVDVMYRTEVGRHTIFELNKLLYTSKEAFTDPKSTKSIVEFMKHILESDTKLTPEKCEQINNCLLLLRNILHIPETNANFIVPEAANPTNNGGHNSSMQNSILWNLFIQSIDKLLLYLMTCPQRACWGVTIVQLIALMYKDQHVGTLQKLLNLWFEASLSESSEDNESNTSPPKQASGDSSPMLTSDPTSDSSDTGSGGGNNKNENSEERRQNMREDTEATLQEVSRKGQAYQNSMLRMHLEEPEDIVENVQTNENEFAVKIEETTELFESTVDKQTDTVKEVELADKQERTVENLSEQTIAKETDDVHFKPPIAIPAKSNRDVVAADATHKAGQKSTNSGQNPKNICYPQKRECPSSQSELSDCGYGTQVENQDFVSTSSNEDDGPQGKPQHQKPPCNSKTRIKQRTVMSTSDTKELRRKKLVKRSKSSLINMKGLVQHTPTDEDISNLLKEFTVDFLLKGYGHLVQEIHLQLLTNIKIPIDTSHFFWLVTYFLKFAAQLELDMEHINTILTFDVISYLTYEGVMLCEQLELNARQEGSDLKPYLRRMHLVVTAIREFLQAIETFKKISHLSEEDRDHLKLLQIKIGATEDLRLLFLLLLRRFNPGLHTKQYLQDLIVTNHTLLLILDSVSNSQSDFSIDMVEHISQFATIEVMYYYGLLLEDFNNNGQFVNDCIFTMMHHICGDLSQVATLFQPVILKTYSRIWETDYELCDDWSDLIEYVIHKFINTPQKSPLALPATSLTEMTKEHNLENSICSWTQEEMDTLYWYYIQSKKNNDVVGKIVRLFSNNINKQKSRISIIQQLLQQDIITLVEYDDLMKFEDAEYQRALLTTPTESTTESGIELKDSIQSGKPSDDIQTLRDLIIKEKKTKHLVWLQKLLLECCYIKYLQNEKELYEHKNDIYVMESVAYHCILKNKSIPVVQWNSEQASFMLYQPFVLLLHKLGFQLPVDAGSIYARIPEYWSASIMFNLAKKLGPFDKLPLKFEAAKLEEKFSVGSVQVFNCQQTTASNTDVSSNSSLEVDSGHLEDSSSMKTSSTGILATIPEVETGNTVFAVPKSKPANSGLRFATVPTPVPSVPNWLQVVMRSKCNLSATSIGNEQKNIDALSTLLTTKSTTALITSTTACLKTTISTTKATTMTNAAAPLLCQSISNLIETNVFTSNVTATANCANNQAVPSYVNEQDKQQQQQQLNQQQEQQQQQINLDDDAAMRSIERTDNTRTGTATLESEYSAMVASVYEQEFANSDTASVASDLTRMYVSDEDEKHDY